MFDTIFIVLHLMTVTKSGDDVGTLFEVEENRFLFNDTIWEGNVGSLLACSQTCARRDDCRGAHSWSDQGTCSLLSEGRARNFNHLLKEEGCFYLEKVRY